ncbi:UNVERIFIED_CONTAM: hypothetical protein FKN15_016991 [Acipenser sinensis]
MGCVRLFRCLRTCLFLLLAATNRSGEGKRVVFNGTLSDRSEFGLLQTTRSVDRLTANVKAAQSLIAVVGVAIILLSSLPALRVGEFIESALSQRCVSLAFNGDSVDLDGYEDLESDAVSMIAERNEKDEECPYDAAHQSPPVSAQDLQSVFKGGYLEKRRKDKQQRDEFGIDGYTVRMNNVLRKDSKKDCCFEITAPEKCVYQLFFINIDMASGIIPEDDDYDDGDEGQTYDDIALSEEPGAIEPIDEDIYEELPGFRGNFVFIKKAGKRTDFCHSESDGGQGATQGTGNVDVSEKVNLTQALTFCHSESDGGQGATQGTGNVDVSEKVNLTQALTIDPPLCLL